MDEGELLAGIDKRLARIENVLGHIYERTKRMTNELDNLEAQTVALEKADTDLRAAFKTLSDELTAAIAANDPARVKAVSDRLAAVTAADIAAEEATETAAQETIEDAPPPPVGP